MQEILPYIQIVISILLVTVILLQQGGAAMGAAFGQGDSFHTERRGSERVLFIATVVLGVLFIAIAVYSLLL